MLVEVLILLLLWYCVTLGSLLILAAFVVIMPFSRSTFVAFGSFLQRTFLETIVCVMEVYVGIEVEISGDVCPPGESAMVLPNHLNHDWAPLYCMAHRMQMLGWVKTVIKKVVQYIPGFGWVMWMLYWPFISRDWASDAKHLDALFEKYTALRMPLQLWLFSEGTRQTPSKLAESQAYAKAAGHPAFDHVMLPRPKGFIAAVHSLRTSITHVYDVTLAYEGWSVKGPGVLAMMKRGDGRKVFHIHVRRIPIGDLPLKDEEMRKWLMQCFVAKDAVLAHYVARKRMPGTPYPRVRPSVWTFLFPLVMWGVIAIVGTLGFYRIFF